MADPNPYTYTQLCLFAEGTRFTPEKHEVSKEFARSRGLPELKHHLIPRTKGFNFVLKNMDRTSKSQSVCACVCVCVKDLPGISCNHYLVIIIGVSRVLSHSCSAVH